MSRILNATNSFLSAIDKPLELVIRLQGYCEASFFFFFFLRSKPRAKVRSVIPFGRTSPRVGVNQKPQIFRARREISNPPNLEKNLGFQELKPPPTSDLRFLSQKFALQKFLFFHLKTRFSRASRAFFASKNFFAPRKKKKKKKKKHLKIYLKTFARCAHEKLREKFCWNLGIRALRPPQPRAEVRALAASDPPYLV